MSKDVDYFVNNPAEFDLLTDEQKDIIEGGGVIDGDTEQQEIDELNVSESLESDTETGNPPEPGAVESKETETVVLAKDGKHTIPYSELENARSRAAELEAFVQSQNQLIEELRQAKLEDKGTGRTDAQDAVMEAYQGDFPEIAEDMKPFIQKMIDEGIKQGISAFQEQVKSMVEPAIKTTQELERERYFNAIADKHPDYKEVDQDLKDWIMKRPTYARQAYIDTYSAGSAEQVIELFTEFKASTGRLKEQMDKSANAEKTNAIEKAKQTIANTKPKAPNSLTDIPNATIGATDEAEAVLSMTPRQLEAKFAGKSPAEIMKLLDKLV